MTVTTITETQFLQILSSEGIDTPDLPRLLIQALRDKGMKVATAESCTGGLISKLITDESGASQVFDCGVCSYANNIKEKLLGVKRTTLEQLGAVSPETAQQMAEGIRALSGADVGIATTGIAGPTGGTPDKPVGLIYIGIATNGKTKVIKADFSAKNNNRGKNRQLSAFLAIYCGLRCI